MKEGNLEPAGEYVGQLDHVPVGEVEGLKPGDGCLREVSATVVPQRQANLLLSEPQCQSKQIQQHYTTIAQLSQSSFVF